MTAYTQSDPQTEVIERIQAFTSGRSEDFFDGVTVSTKFPSSAAGSPSLPHVQVGWDGSVDEHPVTERGTIRVTCWLASGKRASVKQMAGIVRGLLLATSAPGLQRIRPATGRLPGTDPDTGHEFCSFTVLASTEPIAVS